MKGLLEVIHNSILQKNHLFLCVTGSGGKTTLIKALASFYKSLGKTVLITTTTKIQSSLRYNWDADFYITDEREILSFEALCPCTVLFALKGDSQTKLTAPDIRVLEKLKEKFDIVLCEADGAKMLPLKVHTFRDPVVPSFCDYTIAVIGGESIGKYVKDTTFGFDLLDGDKTVDSSYIQKLVDVPEGLLKCTIRGKRLILLTYNVLSENITNVFDNIQWPCDCVAMAGSVIDNEYIRKNNNLAVIRGAGDIASGIAVSLFKNGYQVIMTELPKPTVIRRAVSFAQAVFEKTATVEGVTAEFCTFSQIEDTLSRNRIAVVCDSSCSLLKEIKPFVLIDAVLAKRNIGTSIDMAPFVIGVGPGFTAGLDCDVVIETMRGYEPGKIIYKGSAVPNTGIPGLLGGYSTERVLYTENCGVFKAECKIGDIVREGQIIAYVGNVPVKAKISGKVRGLLMDGLYCPEHFKIADIDSRGENVNHIRCSDKANAIASGVIKAISEFKSRG